MRRVPLPHHHLIHCIHLNQERYVPCKVELHHIYFFNLQPPFFRPCKQEFMKLRVGWSVVMKNEIVKVRQLHTIYNEQTLFPHTMQALLLEQSSDEGRRCISLVMNDETIERSGD